MTRPYDPAGYTKHSLRFCVILKDGREGIHTARVITSGRADFRRKVADMARHLPAVLDNVRQVRDVLAAPEGKGLGFLYVSREQIGLADHEAQVFA